MSLAAVADIERIVDAWRADDEDAAEGALSSWWVIGQIVEVLRQHGIDPDTGERK